LIPLLEVARGLRTMPDDPFWFRVELLTDRHEHATLQVLRSLIQPGMTVLDIGAHVGYYTRHFSRLVGPRGQVISFEPQPRTYATLNRNVSRFSNVTALQIAVAEQEGTAELFDYLVMSASGSLHYDETMADLQRAQVSTYDVAPRITQDFPVQSFTVRTMPVDRCLSDRGIERVDVIKMDIEGAEIGALRGMVSTINHSPGLHLVMEYNPQALKAFGHDPLAALSEVLAMGFTDAQIIGDDGSVNHLDLQTSVLRDLTTRLMSHMGVVNLLLTRGV